jgi:hypothetical protein
MGNYQVRCFSEHSTLLRQITRSVFLLIGIKKERKKEFKANEFINSKCKHSVKRRLHGVKKRVTQFSNAFTRI